MIDYLTLICLDCPHESQESPFTGKTTTRKTLEALLLMRHSISEAATHFIAANRNSELDLSFFYTNSYLEYLNPNWWAAHGNHRIDIVAIPQFADYWLKEQERNE